MKAGSDQPGTTPHDHCGAEKEPLPPGVFMDSLSAKPGSLRLSDPREGDDWREGDAVTYHGVVSIYTQGRFSGKSPLTRLDFVAGGRLHIATWRRTFSDRFLLTLAKRFAAQVAREHSSPPQAVPPIRDEKP